jgi:hypothetical protein
LPLSSAAEQRSSVTRSISLAAFNQKADLASINYNPEDNNVDSVFTMQEYFRSQVEEKRIFLESPIRFGTPI